MTLALALNHLEGVRNVTRAAQATIVARVVRESIWAAHPEGHRTLRDFIRSAIGNTPSTVSDLSFLEELVPWADRRELPVDAYLVPSKWGYVREVIPALRRAVSADDVEGAAHIFADVDRATTREALRKKYRQSSPSALGAVVTLESGEQAVVIVPADRDSLASILRALSGKVEWDLPVHLLPGGVGIGRD
jgi:hypothetical protein